MRKIASPNELQAELRAIMAFIQGYGPEGKPDRQVLAGKLRELAQRVAGGSVKDLGRPDVLTGMKYGGTRYKYNFGIFIDFVEKEGTYYVNQAGRPTKKLGKAKSLPEAEKIAAQKGDLTWA